MAMIEMALQGDPENSELRQLQVDLGTLIQLTEESIQDQAKATTAWNGSAGEKGLARSEHSYF